MLRRPRRLPVEKCYVSISVGPRRHAISDLESSPVESHRPEKYRLPLRHSPRGKGESTTHIATCGMNVQSIRCRRLLHTADQSARSRSNLLLEGDSLCVCNSCFRPCRRRHCMSPGHVLNPNVVPNITNAVLLMYFAPSTFDVYTQDDESNSVLLD